MPPPQAMPALGVVIVAFNTADVILDCLESLLAARDVQLHIVVVDNASQDDTPARLRAWASGAVAYDPRDLPFGLQPCAKPVILRQAPDTASAGHSVCLIEAGVNAGFAAGVNRGLALLARLPGLDRFWVLNPDSAVPPATPQAFATAPAPAGGFGLMGGRVLYLDTPDRIQIDGGEINWKTGVTENVHLGRSSAATPPPDATRFDFITGASMVVSRAFYEAAGPMPEDYFLYYEEVEWALRRGRLPLVYCAEGIVFHRAGTAIGSPTLARPASAFSLYFKHRGRMRFMRRFRRRGLITALAYSLAKGAQLLSKGYPVEAWTLLAGSLDLPPPAAVRDRLTPEAARLAFGPRNRADHRQAAGL